MNLEAQKTHFANHVATFKDYGDIKILDFQKPRSGEYRIRFLFEEQFCRMHISGDLGHLIATNYSNMRYDKFAEDFANNVGYFEGKIECHDRPLYHYDEDKARVQLAEWLEDQGIGENEIYEKFCCPVDEFIDDIIERLDYHKGLSDAAINDICSIAEDDYDAYHLASGLGKEPSGILDLYMLAFRLAQKQLKERCESNA